MTFSFGETSNGGIFDRRYFPWWTLLIHTCSSSMRMNREKGREGGRERKWLGANSFRAQNGNRSREDTYV